MCEPLCQRYRCSHTVVTPGRLGCRPRRLIGVLDVCQISQHECGENKSSNNCDLGIRVIMRLVRDKVGLGWI